MKTNHSPSFTDIDVFNIECISKVNRFYTFNQSDGSISRVIKISGVNDTGFAKSSYSAVHKEIYQMLKSIDSTDIDIQFFKIRRKVDDIEELVNPAAPVYLTERNRFLREELIKKGEILKDHFYISVAVHPASEDDGIVETFKKNIKFIKDLISKESNVDALNDKFSPEAVYARLRRLDMVIQTMTICLENIKCDFNILNTKKDILKCYSQFLRDNRGTNFDDLEKSQHLRSDILKGTRTDSFPSYFIHDGYFHRSYMLDFVSPEDQIYEKSLKAITEAPFEFNYMVAFRITTHEEAVSKLNSNIKIKAMIDNSENSGNAEVTNLETSKDREVAHYARQLYTEEGSVGVECAIHFTYRESVHEVNKKLKSERMTIDSYIQELDQRLQSRYFSHLQQSYWAVITGPWENYCRTLPGFINLKRIAIKTHLELPSGISNILPLYNHERPDIKYYGVNHFFTENRTLLPIDLFDVRLPSWLYLIFGDMGSGKSVNLNVFLAMLDTCLLESGKNAIFRIVDWGGVAGSFYKQAKVRGGTVLNFATGKKPTIQILELTEMERFPTPRKIAELEKIVAGVKGYTKDFEESVTAYFEDSYGYEGKLTDEIRERLIMNNFQLDRNSAIGIAKAFELGPGECEPAVDGMNKIMGYLETILSPSSEKVIIDYSRDIIMDHVRETYRKVRGRFPFLHDIYLSLLESSTIDPPPAIVTRLKNWTREGTYKMFDRESNVDLTSDFILFDMYGLDKDPKLKTMYGIAITSIIQDDMYKKMDRVRACLIDEASFALETPSFRKFMVNFSKTSRKYKFLLALAMQTPGQLYAHGEEEGLQISDLATNKVFCGFNSVRLIEETARRYRIAPGVVHEMKTLGIKKGDKGSASENYSKFMMISEKIGGQEIICFRNILSPFEYQLFSSSAEDNAILRFYLDEENYEIIDTIRLVAEKRFKDHKPKELLEYLILNNKLQAAALVRKYI